MLHIGMVFMMIALVCYSLAVWRERFIKKVMMWMVVVFALGFICDISGTSIMFYISKTKFHLTFHSSVGYFALTVMLLHLVWAILSILKIGKYEEYFTRFSIIAWTAWIIAFISGMIMNMK